MRKFMVLFMSALLMFTLAAAERRAAKPTARRPRPAEEESAETSAAGDGKTLVVYYSASGNTEAAAGYIAEATGADVFELVPAEPYTDADLDYTDDGSRVVYEYEHPDDREVALEATTVSDLVVLRYRVSRLSYLVGNCRLAVNGFIEANDFTGKTVIPFCTSVSSGLGDSGTLLAEAAGTGNWLDGERFSSGVSAEEIGAWVRQPESAVS